MSKRLLGGIIGCKDISHSAYALLVANPEKLLYTVANPARSLLNREKINKRKKLAARIEY